MIKKIRAYVGETYDELINKVSWPSWSELQGSAVVVSIASLIIAFVIYLMDTSISTVLRNIYRLFL